MTEEEYFRKNYPESCYGDKSLSPHWDFFQDGVEFGERQSEKKIEELEKENAKLKEQLSIRFEFEDSWKREKEELEKENAELKCECRRCVYSDCPCILSDYGRNRNGVCEHFKDVFDENTELKERNRGLDTMLTGQSLLSNGLEEQLTNAKELLKKLVECDKEYEWNLQIAYEAEQFLSEVSK